MSDMNAETFAAIVNRANVDPEFCKSLGSIESALTPDAALVDSLNETTLEELAEISGMRSMCYTGSNTCSGQQTSVYLP